MKRGDELTVEIESLTPEGAGIARVEGLVVFVREGVHGDRLRVQVTRVRKNFAEASILEVMRPSASRVTPRCRYFGECGGCRLQHVDYAAQAEFKRRHVVDALERIGGFRGIEVRPALAAASPYLYRNKMEFSFGERWLSREELERADVQADRFAVGLHIPVRFDKVLDIEECWLQSEASVRIVNEARLFCRERSLPIHSTRTHTGYLRHLVIRHSERTGDLMVNLVTSEERPAVLQALTERLRAAVPSITTVVNNITTRKAQVAVGETESVYYGPGYITEVLGARRYRVSANSFFQTNTAQAERLYDAARDAAELRREDIVYDLYSGTGTIALHLADAVERVVGVETVESAVADARRNAAFNGVGNCEFVVGDLKERLTRDTGWMQEHPLPSAVILDPPRAGCHEDVLKAVARLRPERIVYVSCNPATQARDAQILCSIAPYVPGPAQPVDMFPQTGHVENILPLRLLPS
jgi:23S rRNA (uracil1939-C5)-methyltransferase